MENKTPQVMSDDIEQEEVEIIGIHTLCRLCASQNERLIGIFSEEGISNDLSNKINLYLPVKVALGDELPLQCCWNCASTLLAWHELVVTSVETERRFRNSQFISDKQIEDVHFDNPQNPPSDDNIDGSSDELKSESIYITCDLFDDTEPPDPGQFITCQPQGVSFEEVADLSTKTCISCDLKFNTRTQLRTHVDQVHQVKQKRNRRRPQEILPEYFCEVCKKGYTRRHDMEKHRAQTHPEYQETQRPVESRQSDKVKTKRSQGHADVDQTKAEVLSKCRKRDSDGKVSYTCDFCERRFRESYDLLRHRTIHTGEKKFSCHICGERFRLNVALTKHVEVYHLGVKKYSCEVCDKKFIARQSRDEHMNIHTDTRPFVCDVCGKAFKQQSALFSHKMFHKNNVRFQCSTCGRMFRRMQELKVHNWVHTGHKPYACNKCSATFRLRNQLNRHLRVHDKLRECVCEECGKVFHKEKYLKLHLKVHGKAETYCMNEIECVVTE